MTQKGPLLIVPWRCTLECAGSRVHCESHGKPAAEGELDTAQALKMVDQISDFGAGFFGVTGGQPFLRKDLFKVIAHARKLGLNASIITDGRLMDQQAVEEIIKNQVKISVSIDGGKETDDAIRGEGAYDAAVKAIERFSARETAELPGLHVCQRRQSHKRKRSRHAPCD